MNTNIFYQIEKNATEDNYLNEIAVTQINSKKKLKEFLIELYLAQVKRQA